MDLNIDSFYNYLREREAIRLRRAQGYPPPWTEDEILRTYSFTNVKRIHDKTTQRFIDLLYKDHQDADPRLVLLNAGIARYFGTSEFVEAIGGWQDDFDYKRLVDTAMERLARRERVFTGAYLITSGGRLGPKPITVAGFIRDLWNHAEEVVTVAKETQSWQKTVEYMRVIDGFAGTMFMAKETTLDARLTNALWENGWPKDGNDWTPIGPGTARGAARVMGDNRRAGRRRRQAKATAGDTLLVCKALFAARADYWPSGWVELELCDIAFGLCEYDKMERTRLGEGRPRSKYHYAPT